MRTTEKEYKKKMIILLSLSIKKDIDKWKDVGNNEYRSPVYSSNYAFIIDKNFLKIKDYGGTDIVISKCGYYNIFDIYVPKNFKIYYYFLKLKRHFKRINEQEQKMAKEIKLKRELKNYSEVISSIEKEFKKEIRAEKLRKL